MWVLRLLYFPPLNLFIPFLPASFKLVQLFVTVSTLGQTNLLRKISNDQNIQKKVKTLEN